MVYSNVNKKADSKSASSKEDVINLDDEIVIGLASFPAPDKEKNKNNKKKAKAAKKKENDGQAVPKTSSGIKKQNLATNKNSIKKENGEPTMTLNEKIRRAKIRVIKKISIFLLMMLLLIGGIIYFFLSPAFNVKTIEVVNNNHVKNEQIINSSGIRINENMFKFSKKEVKKNILSNPYIEDVKISRNIFTDKVQIEVEERTATLMLEYGNSYVYINNQGYILEISSTKLNSPILKGYVTPLDQIKPGNRLNKNDLERLETVLNIMKIANANNFGQLITYIDIKSTADYILYLESEDKTVHLGNCYDLSNQMPWINEMLEREKGREGDFFVNMDLNTGRPFFREKV